MKKMILAMILCTGFIFPAAFAGDDSINAHIANTLSVLFKITSTNTLMNANDYQQHTFVYNGILITAFKSKSANWVGFFKRISAEDLPETAQLQIKNEYKGCSIENVTMYFNNEGDVEYFTEIKINNQCIVLKIQPSGELDVFDCVNQGLHINSDKG